MYLLEVGFEESMPHSPFRLVPALLNHSYHRHTWPASVPVILNQGTSFFSFFFFPFSSRNSGPPNGAGIRAGSTRTAGGLRREVPRVDGNSGCARWRKCGERTEKRSRTRIPVYPLNHHPHTKCPANSQETRSTSAADAPAAGGAADTRIYICMHAHHPAVAAASPPAGSCMN